MIATRARRSSAPAHGVGYAFAGDLQRALPSLPAISRWIVAGSRQIVLSNGENTIGREPSCIVQLDAAGISRRHAQIVVTAFDARIEDFGSKNGTTVNDRPVAGATVLHDGDRISVGPVVVIYHASVSGVSTETIAHNARKTPGRL